MVFSSALFLLLFLPIVFIGYILIKRELSNYFLLIASLVFYAWGEPRFVFLMIVSVVLNWLFGLALKKVKGKIRTLFLIVGITCDLGILGYYKYAVFFAKMINGVVKRDIMPVLDIALPIGISFFTFQAMSYIIDVYRHETDASNNLANVALYISFFPQLIAGPIVKYRDINKQIENRSVSWIDIADGFKRFIYGLGKKVLIANTLGMCVDTIYSYDIIKIDCKTAWLGALAYTFQIYYDFSGYSDMAIGLGRMFGFRIIENFDYPYLSGSLSEFWRKWHISLGTWFREYVYIPLGGNKKNNTRTYINLMVVFFLTGLWHGADLSFISWGLYHGFFIIVERIGLKRILKKVKAASVIYTFFVVNIGWVLFRADDTRTGLRYIARMLMPWRYQKFPSISTWNYMGNKTIFMLLCAFFGMGFINKFVSKRVKLRWNGSVIEAAYCVCILILSLASVASNTYNPFIYFQF